MDKEQVKKVLQVLQHTRRQVDFLNTKLKRTEKVVSDILQGVNVEDELNEIVKKSPYPKPTLTPKSKPRVWATSSKKPKIKQEVRGCRKSRLGDICICDSRSSSEFEIEQGNELN
jgi:hypothetical protein